MFPPRKKSSKHVSSSENVSTREDHQKDLFEVHFLGIVPDIVISGSHTRDREAQLVDRIEEAQIEGRLPMVAQDDEKVKLNISIHGFIVLGMKGQEVLQRHPLHTIAQVVQYCDGGTINNIAFKIGNVNKPVFRAYIFQCLSEEQASEICQNVRAMFDKVTEKNR